MGSAIQSQKPGHYEPPSDTGGERAAMIYSLTETAKLNALDPEDYLRQVLERIADDPVSGSMSGSRGTSPQSG
jgi:IS66 C-terminal element